MRCGEETGGCMSWGTAGFGAGKGRWEGKEKPRAAPPSSQIIVWLLQSPGAHRPAQGVLCLPLHLQTPTFLKHFPITTTQTDLDKFTPGIDVPQWSTAQVFPIYFPSLISHGSCHSWPSHLLFGVKSLRWRVFFLHTILCHFFSAIKGWLELCKEPRHPFLHKPAYFKPQTLMTPWNTHLYSAHKSNQKVKSCLEIKILPCSSIPYPRCHSACGFLPLCHILTLMSRFPKHFSKHYNAAKIRENGLLSFCWLANEFIYPQSSLEMQKWLISHHKARNRHQTFSLCQEKTIVRLKLLISCSSHKGEHPGNSLGYIVRKRAQNSILLSYYRQHSFDKGSESRKTRKIRK